MLAQMQMHTSEMYLKEEQQLSYLDVIVRKPIIPLMNIVPGPSELLQHKDEAR